MTKELLEDYPHICAEIKELERTVTDSVQGSMPDYPYTPRSITIQGLPRSNQEQITFLRAQKAEIEEFVRSLPHSILRQIVEMRAFKGFKWDEIAGQICKTTGKSYSANAIKIKYYQIFKNS